MNQEQMNSKELMQQFQISEQDLLLIRDFGTQPKSDVVKLIDDFYIWLEDQVWYGQYFSEGVPPTVQSLQRDYWQGFLEAQVNDHYVKQRVTVGRVHAVINLPVTAYLAGMNFAQSWFAEVAQKTTKDPKKCIALLSAINKLIQLDCNIVMHVYSLQSMDAVRKQGELTRRIVSEATRVVRSTATGNFNIRYQSQDESDALEEPINRMIDSLKRFNEETEKEKWLKTGIADLALQLRGGLSIDQLCNNAMQFLANYLQSQVGVFYVTQDDRAAVLSASFAYTRRKNLSNVIQPGEGLVGQALKEQKVILLRNIPDNYITINSGLGEHIPRNIVVQPLIYEQEVKGVLELGSFDDYSDDQLEFLGQISESIAVAINSAQDQEKMQHLLTEAQQTSEKLQLQQEELEAANQTLEEQAQALKQSEEELTTQRDMLEESNKELQLKTHDLERQKSEVEHARQELQQKADQLANSSRYKSEFLANMSHELRTPLNSLLLLSQTLISNREANLTEEQIEDLRVIYSGGNSLLSLINDILDLSKVEAGKMLANSEVVDLKQLKNKIESQFKPVANERNLDFKIYLDDAIQTNFYTDEQRLEQILRNLLSNAFKFTHEGSVTLEITQAGSDQNPLKMATLAFVVKDTGIGIAPKNQTAIFEAFQQGDGSTVRAYGGTGLGLTISREMANLLGGEITLSSEEGGGSEFTLYIPLQQELRREQIQPSHSLLPATGENSLDRHSNQSPTLLSDRGKHNYVLIVEDEPSFGKILAGLAKDRGFTPLLIDNGMEALKVVLTHAPVAVILDMGLPDTDSLKVLESLKASPQTRQIPVHIISSQDKEHEALKRGALGFLTKPASPEDLDKVFAKFETLIQKGIKHILLVEDDQVTSDFIRGFLTQRKIQVHAAASGELALQILKQQGIDCCILDLSLEDMNGFEFLQMVDEDPSLSMPPIVVYTAKDLSEQEYKRLLTYTDRIIIKDGQSPERLNEEVELFLHSVENTLPPSLKRLSTGSQQVNLEDLKGRKVLLVDDDLRNVYALSKVLKDHGLNVSLADNGKLAVEKLRQEQDVDLVLMDIMMPVMDGYQAMREIRSTVSSSIPIIALTAKAMTADREKCIEAGASDYMSKPVEMDNLLSMLKVWCYH